MADVDVQEDEGVGHARRDGSKEEWLAFLAIGLGVLAFLPAIWTLWKRKSSRDISVAGVALRLGAAALWIAYAFSNRLLTNAVSGFVLLLMLSVYLFLVMHYRNPRYTRLNRLNDRLRDHSAYWMEPL